MESKLKELFDIINYPEENCSGFMALCDKAKALIFDAMVYSFNNNERDSFIELLNMCDLLGYNMTPVEQIFWVAYCIYLVKLDKYQNIGVLNDILPIPLNLCLIEEMRAEEELFIDGRKIKPDFIMDFSRHNIDGYSVYPLLKDLK